MAKANLGWMGIAVDDLAHVAAGYASCIVEEQEMRLADGTVMTASAIADAVRRGWRIDFNTADIGGDGRCRNPIIGVVPTSGDAVRIGFEGGRSVSLTTGHMLPIDEVWKDEEGRNGWLPVRQQMIMRAGAVRPGMHLLDGRVEEVERLGKCRAVRMWTSHPGWITTADGLSIGSRWHEVLHAWATTQEVEGEMLPDPISATGWMWGTGNRWEDGRPVLLSAPDRHFQFKPDGLDHLRGVDTPVNLSVLGSASNVRQAVSRRWNMAAAFPQLEGKAFKRMRRLGGWDSLPTSLPIEGERARALEVTLPSLEVTLGDLWGNALLAVRPKRHLRLVRPTGRRFANALVGGGEVVGRPTIVTRLYAVAI